MSDIRSFFKQPGGGAPPRPAAKPPAPDTKKGRSKGRRVIDDSDEDDEDDDIQVVAETKKSGAKSTPKKKPGVGGVEMTASTYFASKTANKSEVPVRSSPRNKKAAEAPQEAKEEKPSKNGTDRTKRSTATYKKFVDDDDDDAYMDGGDDGDDGDDIFAADIKGRKRRTDDYMDDESEDEVLPQPKRVASRGRPAVVKEETKKPSPAAKKRKTPEVDEEDEEEDVTPAKKKTAAKPRGTKSKKKEDRPEDPGYKDILNSIPTVRAPTPPPKDPDVKFDWKSQRAGNNAAAPPNPGGVEVPEGEPGCLTGLTFVFTGVLRTIGRDEAQALVKRYDGKVTGAPSSKTSYVVLGDDAGPSKLKKIRDNGIKTIDETGLFELIRKLPAFGGGGKGAEKALERKKKEEDKVKEQAMEMEREEKARKVAEEKAAKAAASSRGVATPAPVEPKAQLMTTKYAPSSLAQICGNKIQVERIQTFLRDWQKAKKYEFKRRGQDGLGGTRALIISGPPGIGKTTAAHLAAKLEGYDVLESNASDTRSQKLVEAGLSDVMNNTSLRGYFAGDGKKVDEGKKKMVLIMDEVDGMSAGDRGGVGALAKFCKKTEVPLILICNERRLPKMRPFDHVALDIRFNRPTVDQVRSRIMTICHREKLKVPPAVLNAMIEGCNKDIRQIINMISTIKLDKTSMDFDETKAMTKAWEKHVILKPWDICHKIIGGGMFAPGSKATLNEKIELYFNDHEFSYLMVQENYIKARPAVVSTGGLNPREQRLKALELMDKAAESISDGDLVDRMIHGPQQQWSLMPTHAVFSTVRPASFIWGQCLDTSFTSWLGNNSKFLKLSRFVREIHSHMRLKASGDHHEVRQQYLPVLWNRTIKRLSVDGKEAVEDVIDVMDNYYLTREDFDSMKELGVGPQDESGVSIDTQAKATFTRTYNSMRHPIPFMKASNVMAPPKRGAKEAPDLEEAIEEEDDGAADDVAKDDDEDDLKADKLIKQPKAKAGAKKAAAKKAKKDDVGDDSEDTKPAKTKGRGRPAGVSKGGKK